MRAVESADEAKLAREQAEPEEAELSEENRRGLAWLREYMSTPDDMGKEWWDGFRRELANNRFNLREGR